MSTALLASLAVLALVLVGVVRSDGRRPELWWSRAEPAPDLHIVRSGFARPAR